MKVSGLRLANPVKCGRKEDTIFYDHDADCELVALKIPVLGGSPGETTTQIVIKMTSKAGNKTVYTSLMNTMWWTMPEEPVVVKRRPAKKKAEPESVLEFDVTEE